MYECKHRELCNPCLSTFWYPSTTPHPCGSLDYIEARGYTISSRLVAGNTRPYNKEIKIIGGANIFIKMHYYDEKEDYIVPLFL